MSLAAARVRGLFGRKRNGVAPLEEQLGSYLTQRRFQTWLLIGFSLVALLMAAIGIYGEMSEWFAKD